jgi:hypothetical protein
MGNMAITNSFKPKETLREREFSFVSQGEIVNEGTKEGLTPNANSYSKEIVMGPPETNLDENLIYVVDESNKVAERQDFTLEGVDNSKLNTVQKDAMSG